MLPCRQLLGGDAEGLILPLVARHRAEEMTVELRHYPGERSATRFVEPRFADVFSRSLGGVEAECPDAVQLEDGREEPVGECFGITSGPRQLLRAPDVPRGVDDDSRLRPDRRCSSARARPNDPPYHVAEVHHDDDEQDHGEADPDAVPGSRSTGASARRAELAPPQDPATSRARRTTAASSFPWSRPPPRRDRPRRRRGESAR